MKQRLQKIIPSIIVFGKIDILHRAKTFKRDPKIFWPAPTRRYKDTTQINDIIGKVH